MMNSKKLAAFGLAGVFATGLGFSKDLPGRFADIASRPQASVVDGVADKASIHLPYESPATNAAFQSFSLDTAGKESSRALDFAKASFGVEINPRSASLKREGLRNLYNGIKEFPFGNPAVETKEEELRGFYYHIIFMNSEEHFFEGLNTEKWTTFQLAHIASDLGLYCVRFRPEGGCFRPWLRPAALPFP